MKKLDINYFLKEYGLNEIIKDYRCWSYFHGIRLRSWILINLL